MRKKQLVVWASCLCLMFGLAQPVHAESNSDSDVIVECSKAGDCELIKAPQPLVNVSNAVPGTTAEWSMLIRNRLKDWCTLSLSFQPQQDFDDLSQVLLLRIYDVSGRARRLQPSSFEVPLAKLVDQPVIFGYLPPQSTDQWVGELEFDVRSGNNYQSASLLFDTLFHVSCDKKPPPRGTTQESGLVKLEPVPANPEPTPSSICLEATPPAPQVKLTNWQPASDRVTLSWPQLPAGELELLFGPSTGRTSFTHWVPSNQNPYHVGQLNPQEPHYFQARLHIGCAVSAWSNVVTTDGQPYRVPTSLVPSADASMGGQVLGVAVTPTPTPVISLTAINGSSCQTIITKPEWVNRLWCWLYRLVLSLIRS